jgi:hypothetical protein
MPKKSRKEIRSEEKKQRQTEVINCIESRVFVFKANYALPLGGSTVNLTSDYDLKIKNDSVFSFLPYFGVAHTAEYGSRTSPMDFDLPLLNYSLEKNKKGFSITFDVKNQIDFLKFSLQVSESGFASLSVTSTNRQSISYTGTVQPIKNKT